MFIRYNIAFILSVCSTIVFSQLQVKNFFTLTGKKNVPVNAITQDKMGFLWLASNEGVYKFDGVNTTSIAKEHPVLKQEISAIYIDKKQTVWVGTKTGKVYFLIKNKLDSINFTTKPNLEKITSFYELSSCMLIGTYGSGIYCYTNQQIKHIDVENGLSDNVVYNITGNKQNTIWCGTDAGITQIKNICTLPTFKTISDKNGLPDNIVRNIALQENRLLISMQDSGICYYNLGSSAIEKISFASNWSLGAVINATSQNPKKLVVATEKNGMFISNNGSFTTYNYENLIQSKFVNQLFIDREQQLWIASKNGVSQFIERRYSFINLSKGLSDEGILALAMDNDNGMWLGTTTGITRLMYDDEGRLIVSKIKNLKKYTISCAANAPDGDIWFGTYGRGIIVLNAETQNSIILNTKDEKLANDNISSIFFSDKHNVYISTLGGGLIKAKIDIDGMYKRFTIEKTYTETEGLGSNYVYASLTDNNGKLYVATDGGGLQVLENNKFINLTKKNNFSSTTVYSLSKDKYNNIWATSNANGILKYNGKTLIALNINNGLRDEQPQQLIASENTVFAINAKGIDKINCTDNKVTYYDLFEGDLEPNLNAVFYNGDKIYSGTNNGLLLYRTKQEPVDTLKPTIFIKLFFVNNKPFAIDSISEFKYNQNYMSFTIDGIWLKNPSKIYFRYKLKGFEEKWNYSTDGKVINYNNLSPNNYTFIAQVKNEEDVWSQPVEFNFTINAPIWKHWWFWILVIGIGLLSIYLVIKYRVKSLQNKNTLLEQRVKERTFQIEQQSKIIESKNIELEQLSLVASKTDNVVLILDAHGKLEYVNESFTKINKMTIDELKKNKGETIYELSNNPNIKEIINDAVKNKRSVNYESLNKKTNTGSEVWASSTLTPLFDEEGKLKKIIIIDSDVSERKKQERVILQKNKDITDSISYARKIQYAFLPNINTINTYLPNSFVLYLTKDIVSGDFYWFTHIDNCSIIAAVDCTGHGVPGAFMSLIGYNLLNKIVNEQKITDPKDILLELNNGVLEALYKNDSESKDGMDIAICKINHLNNTMYFAGAMRPLWIINSSGLVEIKGDKIPIGTKQSDRGEKIAYTTHTIELKKGNSYYIFTDGYADQFGGPKGKKYSSRKFKELLTNNVTQNCKNQEKNIELEHHNWKADNEQVDDILLIGFTL
jgi:PAS domain S-box-containing protein